MACNSDKGGETKKSGKAEQGFLLVISTDTMGRDADIGAVLTKSFFETMREMGRLPEAMFFLNAGVKLTTVNDDTVPVLKDIANAGVEIFSCGTCLANYGLEDKLGVGLRGSTSILIEYMTDSAKVVWV